MAKKLKRIPRRIEWPKAKKGRGLIIVFTGEGKGKTTAAFGTVLRALGHGMRVAVVQFMKGKWLSGEIKALEKFGSQVDIFMFGEGFTWETKNFDKEKALARKAWEKCLELIEKGTYDLVLLDELNYVLMYGFLSVREVRKKILLKPPRTHVIVTGRGAPPTLVRSADVVTEMKSVKHPFHSGILSQKGIDY